MPTTTQVRRKHPEREDARYYEMRRAGKKIRDIALLRGVDKKTVQKGIAAAKARMKAAAAEAEAKAAETAEQPRPKQPAWVRDMMPLFPMGAFTPSSKCPHHGPIPHGSSFVCMVCFQSGKDGHPAFWSRADDPRPDPKPEDRPKSKATRRQRRRQAA